LSWLTTLSSKRSGKFWVLLIKLAKDCRRETTVIAYLFCSILCSGLYYVQAYKSGLRAKNWAAAGLVLGPMVLPLFKAQQRMALLKSRGLQSVLWLA